MMKEDEMVIDPALLDRMADGELSRDEQQALLSRIEKYSAEVESDDWRRLALAYVEAQSFSSEFSAIVSNEDSPVQPHTVDSRSRKTSVACNSADLQTFPSLATANHQTPFGAGRSIAIAVSLFLAFGLGAMWSPVSSSIQPDSSGLAEHPQKQQQPPVATPSPESHSVSRPYLELTIDGQSTPVRVPIISASEVSREWAESEPMAIPPYIRDELVRRGHRVRQRRRFVPVQLANGQQVVIPVDEADVQFVDHRSYQ